MYTEDKEHRRTIGAQNTDHTQHFTAEMLVVGTHQTDEPSHEQQEQEDMVIVVGIAEPAIALLYQAPHHRHNATFAENTSMKDYEDGMLCDGYVVEISEHYSTTRETITSDTQHLAPQDKQMLLTIKLLLVSTTYLGRDRNYKSTFIYQN